MKIIITVSSDAPNDALDAFPLHGGQVVSAPTANEDGTKTYEVDMGGRGFLSGAQELFLLSAVVISYEVV